MNNLVHDDLEDVEEDQQQQQQQQQQQPQQQQIVTFRPLQLRSSSISSLDEFSQQKCSQDEQLNYGGLQTASNRRPPYKNTFHSGRVLDGLNRLKDQGIFTDVTLIAGQSKVKAHKAVLASCSPYFHAMFTNFEVNAYVWSFLNRFRTGSSIYTPTSGQPNLGLYIG